MQPGRGRLVLVDDVLATGGTMRAAAGLCLRAGYSILALATLIDLEIVNDFQWRDQRVRAAVRY
jgi:adenine phosphoribosyltransferase